MKKSVCFFRPLMNLTLNWVLRRWKREVLLRKIERERDVENEWWRKRKKTFKFKMSWRREREKEREKWGFKIDLEKKFQRSERNERRIKEVENELKNKECATKKRGKRRMCKVMRVLKFRKESRKVKTKRSRLM